MLQDHIYTVQEKRDLGFPECLNQPGFCLGYWRFCWLRRLQPRFNRDFLVISKPIVGDTRVTNTLLRSTSFSYRDITEPMTQVLFVEAGFGNDQHGQDATKAAVRACRNAIEFNSIPSITNIVPGGRDNMKLLIQIACPDPAAVDLNQVKNVFPYGKFLPVVVKEGGMKASSGIALPELGDKNDDMYIAVACVTIGYWCVCAG